MGSRGFRVQGERGNRDGGTERGRVEGEERKTENGKPKTGNRERKSSIDQGARGRGVEGEREKRKGSAALAMLRGLQLLDITADVRGLAEILVREKVMPRPALWGDAIHVAAATAHHMDYVLTWNVQHMANPRKRTHFATICLRLGLVPPQIVTPDMLIEADE